MATELAEDLQVEVDAAAVVSHLAPVLPLSQFLQPSPNLPVAQVVHLGKSIVPFWQVVAMLPEEVRMENGAAGQTAGLVNLYAVI